MKKLVVLFVGFVMLLSFTAFSQIESVEAATNGGRLIEGEFIPTTTDGESRDFYVYLPAGFDVDSDLNYASIYMMPFDGFSPQRYFDDGIVARFDTLMATAAMMEMIVIFPTFEPEDDFRGITADLIDYIENEFSYTSGRVIPNVAQRGVLGVSVGGHMAYTAGLTNLETGANVSAPSSFTAIGSHMGNFTGVDNPWRDTYDVFSRFATAAEGGVNPLNRNAVASFMMYVDGGNQDPLTPQAGSTGEIIRRIGMLSATWFTLHPGTTDVSIRPGGHTTAFYMESLERSLGRFSDRFLGTAGFGAAGSFGAGLVADSIVSMNTTAENNSTWSISPQAVAVTLSEFDINFNLRVTDLVNRFLDESSDEALPMEVIVRLTDPADGALLHTSRTTFADVTSAPYRYTGTFTIPRGALASGTSTTAELFVSMMGAELSIGTMPIVNVLPTGSAPHEQLIDLMGDWYFRPYKTGNAPHALDWYDAIMEEWRPRTGHWDIVQPGLGWWDGDFSTDPDWPSNGHFIGHAWYIREFYVPANFAREGLLFSVGLFDEENITYINGQVVGAVGYGTGHGGTMQGEFPIPVRSGAANNIVPGQYINSLEEMSGRPADFTNPWDIRAEYHIDASILNFGGMNTVAVRVNNMNGGGGWYEGPIGIYTVPALNRGVGDPYIVANEANAAIVRDLVAQQTAALADGDLDAFAKTVGARFFQDGLTRTRYIERVAGWLTDSPSGIEIVDNTVFVFELGNLFIYQAERVIRDETGDVIWSGHVQYGFSIEGGEAIFTGSFTRMFYDFIESEETNQTQRFAIYLPPSYHEPGNENRRYPVQFLFHGINSTGDAWVLERVNEVMDAAIAAGEIEEMILVMPDDHNRQSWWGGVTEQYIINELIPHMDVNYRTIPDARFRGTAGFSMGASGSYNMASRNPDMFTFLTNFNGAMSGGSNATITGSLATFQNASPVFAERFSHFFICSMQDGFNGNFIAQVVNMHRIMTNHGVEHFALLDAGGHDGAFYMQHFIPQVAWHQARMYTPAEINANVVSGNIELITSDVARTRLLSADFDVNFTSAITNHFDRVPDHAGVFTDLDLQIPVIVRFLQNGEIVYSQTVLKTVGGAIAFDGAFEVPAGLVDLDQSFEVQLWATILDQSFLLATDEIIAVNRDALIGLVAEAETLNEADFTPETWEAFYEALEAARAVLANLDATQAEVDAAYDALDEAMANLEQVQVPTEVDKAALRALVAEAESLDEARFTAESWAVMYEALEAARAILANLDATQAEVDAALAVLQAALDQLVPIVDITRPEVPGEDEDDATLPETGTAVFSFIMIALGLGILGAVMAYVKKKEANQNA